jgi:NAD(P)H-hydrate epimerase
MAKGGSGDVLAGMLAGLLGQLSVKDAAVAAVWLHGRAGDIAAAEYGEYSMTPTDIINKIPNAFNFV